MKKTAIILMNLGGPDKLSSVKPFLFNLFYDKYIISLPNPFRWLLAKFIATRREKFSQSIYEFMGGKSPILEETENQKIALEKHLKKYKFKDFEIFIYMRYWHPMAEEVASKIEAYGADEVILVPLYPYYSTTTTASSVAKLQKHLAHHNIKIRCCYYNMTGFIDAHVAALQKPLSKITNNHILFFSAHGIPQRLVDGGDPYEYQLQKSVEMIVKKLAIKNLNYKITFQSKVGPLEWLKPYTEDEIIAASKAGQDIYIVPIAFVSEHAETLVELDIEYKELANENGCSAYTRLPALSASKEYTNFLAQEVVKISKSKKNIIASNDKKCPEKFGRCFCREFKDKLC